MGTSSDAEPVEDEPHWKRAEVLRRLVHASGSVLPGLYVLDVASWHQIELLLIGGLVVAGILEMLRLSIGLDWAIYQHLTREYERSNVAGYALYFLSSATVALAFDPTIAVPAILMLTIGDPISGLLSTGRPRSVKRGFVLLAMFGVCTLLGVLFVPPVPAILGAGAATIADGVKPVVAGYVLDDNLTIPPAAALAITAGLALVGSGTI